MNRFKLRPATKSEIKYFDILIDGEPLAKYFAGWLGAVPDAIPPLGPPQPGMEKYRQEQFARFLLEAAPDLPDGRDSVLVCPLCGDLGCGAYSAKFSRQGDVIRWVEFGYENNYSPDLGELEMYEHLSGFTFSWADYESELRRHGDGGV